MSPSVDFALRTLERCIAAIKPANWFALGSIALLLWLGFAGFGHRRKFPRSLRLAIVLVAVALAVTCALLRGWIADSAFASFRYAQNLASQQGFVFNPGDKSSALTNPAWALLLSLLTRCGFTVAGAAASLSIASLAAIIWILAIPSREALKGGHNPPAAAALASMSYVFWCFGTSGLAAMPSALLLLLCTRGAWHRPLWAGIFGAVAALLAPFCLAYVCALGISLVLRRARRATTLFFSPLVVAMGAQLLIHRAYFGSYFPFHVQTHVLMDSQIERGFVYTLLGLCGNGFWSLLPALCAAWWLGGSARCTRGVLLATCAYLSTVAWFGGDELDGHQLIAILPVLLLVAEFGIRELWVRRRWVSASALSVLPAVIVLPNTLLRPGMIEGQLVDPARNDREKAGVLEPTDRCRAQASELSRAFAGSSSHPKIASTCAAVTAYVTSLPTLDLLGDLDAHVFSHRAEWGTRRVRDRHIHQAYLWESGVDLSEVPAWPDRYASLYSTNIGNLGMNLVRYREDVVEQLRRTTGSHTGDIRSYLTRYGVSGVPPHRDCDLGFLEKFYFESEPLTQRQRDRALFLSTWSLSQNEAAFLATGEQYAPRGWTNVPIEFDNSAAFIYRGLSLTDWLSGPTAPDQVDIFSRSRHLLDTYRPRFKNRAHGQLQSPEFDLVGDVITFEIGGGMHDAELYLGLLVGGHVVRRATGCDSDIMRRQVWDTSPWVGKRARLLWVDEQSGDWGHLVTGEIRQWRRVQWQRGIGHD